MVSLSKNRSIISYIFKSKAYAKIFSKFKNTQGSVISNMTFNVHPHIQYYFMCLFFLYAFELFIPSIVSDRPCEKRKLLNKGAKFSKRKTEINLGVIATTPLYTNSP